MSKFDFPLFGFVRDGATNTHDREFGGILVKTAAGNPSGVTVIAEVIRPNHLDVPFVVATIRSLDEKTILWGFQKEGFQGVGRLAMAGDMPVVALIQRGMRGKVETVIGLDEIVDQMRSPDLMQRHARKVAAAEFLGIGYINTSAEQLVLKATADRAAKEAEAKKTREETAARVLRNQGLQKASIEQAEKDAEQERREQERRARFDRIMKRPKVVGFTNNGSRRHGQPVVGDEWMVLKDNTFVMQVATYDDKTGAWTGLTESFIVRRNRGQNATRTNVAEVTNETAKKKDVGPKSVTCTVDFGGKFFQIPCYGRRADLDLLQAQGLNGGTYVGVVDEDGDTVDVYRVYNDKITKEGASMVLKI